MTIDPYALLNSRILSSVKMFSAKITAFCRANFADYQWEMWARPYYVYQLKKKTFAKVGICNTAKFAKDFTSESPAIQYIVSTASRVCTCIYIAIQYMYCQ